MNFFVHLQEKWKKTKKRKNRINVFNNMRFSSGLKFPLTLRAVHVKQLQCLPLRHLHGIMKTNSSVVNVY